MEPELHEDSSRASRADVRSRRLATSRVGIQGSEGDAELAHGPDLMDLHLRLPTLFVTCGDKSVDGDTGIRERVV